MSIASRMDSLNGWQRIWLLLVMGWAIFLTGLISQNWPEIEANTFEISPYSLNVMDKANRNRAMSGLPAYTEATYRAEYTRVNNARRNELEESKSSLNVRRVSIAVKGVSIWVAGSILAYVIPWLLGWVARGFRKNS